MCPQLSGKYICDDGATKATVEQSENMGVTTYRFGYGGVGPIHYEYTKADGSYSSSNQKSGNLYSHSYKIAKCKNGKLLTTEATWRYTDAAMTKQYDFESYDVALSVQNGNLVSEIDAAKSFPGETTEHYYTYGRVCEPAR